MFRIRIFLYADPGKNLHADPDPDPGGTGKRLNVFRVFFHVLDDSKNVQKI